MSTSEPPPTKQPWPTRFKSHLVIISLYLTLFLSALDVTIVAPALPIIATHLQATTSQYTWVGSAYTLASTSTTPLWAKISEICGRKIILMATNAVFLVGSLICALSVSPMMLIGGRVVQGVGGGGIIVMVTIIIGDLFCLRERAKYYALTGVVWAVASGVGPILGGVFTQTVGWRWCFYINLPFDGLSLILLFFFMRLPAMPRSSPENAISTLRTFDFLGSALVISGTVTFLYGLEGGSSNAHAWNSAHTLGLILSGVVLVALFVIYEWFLVASPILPVRNLLNRRTSPCLATAFFHSFAFIPYTYFNPLYFQNVLGIEPIMSGVYLFALVLPLSAMTLASGFYVRRTGSYRSTIWISGAVMLTGTGLFINFNSTFQLHKIIIYQLVAGLGAGPLFQAPMIAFQAQLEEDMVASGNAALAFLKNLSTSLSLVLGGVVVQGIGGVGVGAGGSGDGEQDGWEGEEGRVRLAGALSKMWIFYTGACAVMWIASFGIQRKTLDEGGREGEEMEGRQEGDEEKVSIKPSPNRISV